ncbi:MAG: hypothetical protein COW88_00165 [Candidatus Lloydbacteria bacterium CG22_combo_CG10-13_8_21_14_all_47_15]|uniref:SHS2 domain-containing protein n=1 Tax=Candidatus Lloydbacteria bacterium CG22_combo_CG10-13_8_21_14_all_47_15 TaxID=1974635 RepID=A0A2H0CVT5_9BACT|nr:MAG: hypothetical protein COW88_00165 [Candidatus Lloydbacteria bacterium CG22_combo_CG10-13_8_21_14_all_47_15]
MATDALWQKLGTIVEFVRDSISQKGAKQSVLGIDVGSSFVKIVQLKNKGGKAVLETYGEIGLGSYGNAEQGQATNLPPEKIVEAVSDLFKEANVTTKNAAVAIPLRASLLSLMEVPKLEGKQFDNMIAIEARKYIPVSISEVTLDWWVVPKQQGGDIPEGVQDGSDVVLSKKSRKGKDRELVEVMVVAIHNDALEKYQQIVSALNLESVFFELEVFSTVRATFGRSIAPMLVVDIGAASTKIAIIEYGVVRFSHTINRGSQDISVSVSKSLSVSFGKAEELKKKFGMLGDEASEAAEADGKAGVVADVSKLTFETIFGEINESIVAHQREHNVPVEAAVLTGGGALLKGILPFATEHLNIEVSLGNAFGKIEAPAFLEGVLAKAGPEFAVAAGIALRKLQEGNKNLDF